MRESTVHSLFGVKRSHGYSQKPTLHHQYWKSQSSCTCIAKIGFTLLDKTASAENSKRFVQTRHKAPRMTYILKTNIRYNAQKILGTPANRLIAHFLNYQRSWALDRTQRPGLSIKDHKP